MIRVLRQIAVFFLKPKQFASSQTIDTRLKFHRFYCYLFYPFYKNRRVYLKQLFPQEELKPIPQDSGFRKIEDIDSKLVERVYQEGIGLLNNIDLQKVYEESENKHLVSLSIKDNLDPKNPFMEFALHPPLVKMIGDYIGMLPVIENIMLWYSPNKETLEGSSQYYHLDGQDVRTLQVFLYLDDVTEENGPLTLIEAEASEKLAREFGYKKAGSTKRINDEFANSRIEKDKIHSLTGPKKSLFVADTDRCFHFGSRKGTKPRFLIVFQYYSPFAFTAPWPWRRGLPYSRIPNLSSFNSIERKVLGVP